MKRWLSKSCVASLSGLLVATPFLQSAIVRADEPTTAPASTAPSFTGDPTALDQATVDKALAFLKTKQQPDSSWQAHDYEPIGLTALVLRAFIADSKYSATDDFLDKGFKKLVSYQLDNGGIFKDALASYNTAIAISALASAHQDEYKAAVEKAMKYLRSLQWSDKIEGVPDNLKVDEKDVKYGGFGYGKSGRPDLSNTQMAIDALHDAGVKPDDPAYQAALKFATRSQNLSETNDQSWSGDDGGFIYTPVNGGNSPAGDFVGPGGKRMLRSYGSMTYAGLKSMIYAGLSHDDPRVKAAWDWIGKNFTVDENPGMSAMGPQAAKGGIYYYYYTMSRALSAYGEPIITDAQGKKHDWRIELIQKIASLQNPDGSFTGDRKWMEDNPVLTTSYVVIALEEAKKDLKDHPAK